MNTPASSLQSLSRVRVVMVSTSHPGNIGSAARAMKTMGLSDLVLVAPRHENATGDAQAIALASGATDVLESARIVATLADALVDVRFALALTSRRRELSHGMAGLREAAATAVTELCADSASTARVARCLATKRLDCPTKKSTAAN